MSNEPKEGSVAVTAPQEPLVMTLERALLHLKANAWWLEHNGGGWSVFAWSDRDDPDAIEEVSYGLTWFEAVSEAINRPVVARDSAAELRAATTEYLDARQAWRTSLRGTKAAMRLATAEEALRAAIAATEGRGEP